MQRNVVPKHIINSVWTSTSRAYTNPYKLLRRSNTMVLPIWYHCIWVHHLLPLLLKKKYIFFFSLSFLSPPQHYGLSQAEIPIILPFGGSDTSNKPPIDWLKNSFEGIGDWGLIFFEKRIEIFWFGDSILKIFGLASGFNFLMKFWVTVLGIGKNREYPQKKGQRTENNRRKMD